MIQKVLDGLKKQPIAAIFVMLYLIGGVMYSVVNPIHEATDEVRHYRYVRYLADLGQLPVQSEEEGNAQAHHPPLYYATAALTSFWVNTSNPLYEPQGNPHWSFRNWEVGTDNKNLYLHGPDEAWPYRDASLASHLSRWTTLLWGAATVALTILTAHTLAPEKPAVAMAAGALIALCPMFLYLGAAVNNDVPAGLMGAAITYSCLIIIRRGISTKRLVVLGILYGLALLTKFNLLAMGGVIGLALLIAPLEESQSRTGALVRAASIIGGLTILISGWWYIRNAVLYGEPTGFLRLTEIWGFREPTEGFQLAGRELGYAWTSLWARFGYGQIPMPNSYYLAIGIICGIGLLGLVGHLVINRTQIAAEWRMLAVLVTSVVLNFMVLYAYITVSPAGAMGRFFFPGLSAFAVLVGYGLTVILPQKVDLGFAGAITAYMTVFALTGLFGYIQPAYAIPAASQSPTNPMDVQFGEAAKLLAYHVTPSATHPGDEIDVTVTWEVVEPTPIPFAVFIHLVNEQGALIAQRDTYAGLGTYPSNWWRPGHVFTETYRVFLPETAYTPDEAQAVIGLYSPDFGSIPINGSAQDALQLDSIEIESAGDTEYPNQTFVDYSDHFALVGYAIEPRVARPEDEVEVTLYWEALNPPTDQDFKVFIQVIGEQDSRWASLDGPPIDAATRTRDWESGEVYKDVRVLTLPTDVPSGIYQIHLGWFNDDGERLRIIAEDGRILENYLLLNTLAVTPNAEN